MSDSATEYFNNSFLPSDVWEEKYQLTTIAGEPKEKTPEDMHRRMAKRFGRIEKEYKSERKSALENNSEIFSEYGKRREELYEDKVFRIFDEFEYIVPQGSIMSMLGNPYQVGSLSNCVVIPDVVDSYGGIMYTDQQLAQLFKRRCVHEDSYVLTESNGFVKVADLEVGDYILSRGETENEYRRVTDKFVGDGQKDKYKVTLQSGTTLNLLEDHRVYLSEENQYVKAENLSEGDIAKVSNFDYELTEFDKNLSDAGWFIGCHIGDDSVDSDDRKYQGPRFRITGENKTVVDEYGSILNEFVGSNRKTSEPADREYYESDVYKYTQTAKSTETVLNKYLDGQRGSKVVDASIPSYIGENNLYLPFIGGLIDSDGWIKDNGSAICIRICAKEVIDELAQVLRSSGFSINVFEKPVRKREDHIIQGKNEQYELYIRGSSRFWKEVAPYIKHPKKKEMVENADITTHSRKYFISPQRKNEILGRYESLEWGEGNNQLAAVIYILRQQGELADSGLNTLFENDLIDEEEFQEIRSHRKIKKIEKVVEDGEDYYDLTVEENHNFYTGNFGLCLTHNCGVGVDVSRLRPEGAGVRNAARTSTGVVSFMHRFSDTTNEVAQDGRRGALMLTLDCRHPDMTRFVEEKDDPTTMTGANISAKWTDDFLQAVEDNETYTLRFPVDATPEEAEITKEVNARELFKTASENAHIHGGDPGCMYIDRMEDYSTGCGYPDVNVLSTNPCGEIGMGNDSCRLIAMNLMSVVENPFTDKASVNHELLYKISYEQQRLLDNLVDLEVEAIDKIIEKIKSDPEDEKYKRVEIETWEQLKEAGKKYRRTGGGFTALGDMLASLGVEYGSEECDEVLHEVMSTKLKGEWDASTDLAIERGSFPEWNSEHDNTEFFDMLEEEFPEVYERNMNHGRRNISLSTVAPTGSVSLMSKIEDDFGTTSGIEPLFSTEKNKAWYTRNKRADGDEDYDYIDEEGNKWKQYPVFHNGFRIWMERNGYENPTEKSEKELKEIFKESPYVTSAGLHWEDRLRTQGIVQKYTTHSISSTLNLPEDADIEETYKIYKNGRKYGLKGATIFRNGSKRGVLEGESDESSAGDEITYHDAPERPEVLEADIHQVRYGGEPWKILVGRLDENPYEVFAIKTGGDTGIRVRFTDSEDNKIEEGLIRKTGSGEYNFEAEDGKVVIEDIAEYAPDDNVRVDTRLLSLALRHGVEPEYIVNQLEKANGSVVSFGRAVLKAMRRYLDVNPDDECPECEEESLAFVEGCVRCRNCSFAKCG